MNLKEQLDLSINQLLIESNERRMKYMQMLKKRREKAMENFKPISNDLMYVNITNELAKNKNYDLIRKIHYMLIIDNNFAINGDGKPIKIYRYKESAYSPSSRPSQGASTKSVYSPEEAMTWIMQDINYYNSPEMIKKWKISKGL